MSSTRLHFMGSRAREKPPEGFFDFVARRKLLMTMTFAAGAAARPGSRAEESTRPLHHPGARNDSARRGPRFRSE